MTPAQASRDTRLERVLHFGSFNTIGGVEHLLTPYVCDARAGAPSHALLVRSETIHPHIKDRLTGACDAIGFIKNEGHFRIPRWPAALRLAHANRFVRRFDPQLVLVWNALGDAYAERLDAGRAARVYYEHSAAWFPPRKVDPKSFLERVDAIIACSHASRRMLQLRWEASSEIRVCHNGLRSDVTLRSGPPRTIASDRPPRIGVAARLVPSKGVNLVIHALAELARTGDECELWIAGTGPERERLERECARVGIAPSVRFLGLVRDMGRFYEDLDLFVVPSLCEPFGLIAVEAMAQGVPVIATEIDGLPEVVEHGETGLCVAPELDALEFKALGGDLEGLPEYVYDPVGDSIAAPRAVSPTRIAAAVRLMIDDAEGYTRASASAVDRVVQHFLPAAYQERLDRQLAEILRGGSRAEVRA